MTNPGLPAVDASDWLAVDQLSVTENKHSRRPDVVLFLNGMRAI